MSEPPAMATLGAWPRDDLGRDLEGVIAEAKIAALARQQIRDQFFGTARLAAHGLPRHSPARYTLENLDRSWDALVALAHESNLEEERR